MFLCNTANTLDGLRLFFLLFNGITNATFKQLPGPGQQVSFGDIWEYWVRDHAQI